MKINLIHPPQKGVIDDRLDPPLGLMSIAANLIKNGYPDVSISDLSGRAEDEWGIPHADMYGMTVYSPSVNTAKAIASKCKSINSSSRVVCGGIHATILPETLLDSQDIDAVIRGHGELPMVDLLRDYPDIKREYVGGAFNLEDLPLPNRDLVNLGTYSRTVNGMPSFNMQTSRGCPFHCSFCSEAVLTRGVMYRSPESIFSEMTELADKYGARGFFLYDDIFTINKKRLKRTLGLIEPLSVSFDFHMRADGVNLETCRRLKNAGGHMVRVGIESFSDDILSKMGKGTSRKKNIEAIRTISDSGLLCRIFLIFGFPGENERTVEETISGIEESDPDQIFLSTFVPFPGCDVWNRPQAYGITKIDRDFSRYSFVSDIGKGNLVFETQYESRDKILSLQDKIYRYVYGRKFRGSQQGYYRKLMENISGDKPDEGNR